MAAITKNFTVINDTAVDPDSPVDTALVTALRDNATHLREWLGAGYYAGAKQDHSHDGTDSALVEIGPNLLRNGSFEAGESSWTFTDYSGGSHAISATEYIHGIKSLAITSTVLANGGGYAESNEYVPVGGSQFLSFEIWRWASVVNISSKCEAVWYDNAKAQISVTAIYSDINTPTAKTLVQTGLQAPSTARYARLRVTGGVPGTGTATGTAYFDGGMVGRTYIVEPLIGPAAVTQSKLKTTTGEVTGTSITAVPTSVTLPGGEYGFYPQIKSSSASFNVGWGTEYASGSNSGYGFGTATAVALGITTYAANATIACDGGGTGYLQQRYVQSSPPWESYRLDDAIPVFVFALLDKTTGCVIATYTAEDPPWGNNGPTVINPRGRLMSLAKTHVPLDAPLDVQMEAWADFDEWMKNPLNAPAIAVEMARKFSQAEKNADMPLIPHPFGKYDSTKHVVVILNPCDDRHCRAMRAKHEYSGDSIGEALHGGHIIIDNSPMPGLVTPPGVLAVRARWKLTK